MWVLYAAYLSASLPARQSSLTEKTHKLISVSFQMLILLPDLALYNDCHKLHQLIYYDINLADYKPQQVFTSVLVMLLHKII